MNRTKCWLAVFAVLASVTSILPPASAEWFADLYGGGAFTQKGDIEETDPGATDVLRDVEFNNSFTGGGRVGYWFETPPFGGTNLNLGVTVDAFYFRPDVDTQTVTVAGPGGVSTEVYEAADISVIGISFDLITRWPLLPSAAFPKGQLEPYLTAGPTLFIAEYEDTTRFDPPNQADTDVTVGLKVGTGLAGTFSRISLSSRSIGSRSSARSSTSGMLQHQSS